ncbi:TonB-dependent receptor [Alcanivorax xiamenensis]|uniref:TonB-dependent receptor n=1 Tax=Alcanivorax xiamenensis TaxID=1177156 RepID=A0ABQ6YD37_9GAMM|nr:MULTISPECIES: TonB-dependent receptor [Alcanivorax]KAF0808143.1 TonB-dependent receptor [Alcanivorax xiamenensis]
MIKAPVLLVVTASCLAPVVANADASSAADLDTVVVTPNRIATERREVAANVEVIDLEELTQTPAMFATDFLKKSTSVDVIQYPGGRSGVGLRGFRPEFSGTNQRVLILIDGRPAGITSLGNLPMAGVERVEVLKGSASAVYGSSAMGGVINFITRDSRGSVSGGFGIAAGSYDTLRADAHAGGSLTPNLDFDVAFDERSQFDDYDLGRQSRRFEDGFRQGGGVRRPFTGFETRSGYARFGYRLSPEWRVDARGQVLRGNDVESPGAESDGQLNQGLSDVDAFGLDLSLTGTMGNHQPLARAYTTREAYDSHKAAEGQLLYNDSNRDTRFHGLQLRDAWSLNERWLWVYGLDYEEVSNTSRRYDTEGQRQGPYSPDDERETLGVYSELTSKWLDDRLIVNLGARYDEIENKARSTPHREDLIPGSSRFDTFNPRVGVVFFPEQERRWRLHASAGRGFVAPLTRETSGRTEEIVGQRLQIAYGNPDLDPETSTTYDFGVGYQAEAWDADLTWFLTRVKDKIETVILTSTDDLRETTYVNASRARAEGFEATLGIDLDYWLPRLPGSLRFTTTSTYYMEREQDLPDGREPLRNVARFKINAALDYEGSRFGARLAARHVDGMLDSDYSSGRYFSDRQDRLFEFDSTTLVDADLRWYITPHHTVGVQVENLFNRYYYEKGDYPGPGRLVLANYRYDF